MNSDFIVIVPARIGSTRLKRKLLLDIGKKKIIEHVIDRISKFVDKRLFIATDSEDIAEIVELAGANPIMTSSDCHTGSDRVYEAYNQIKSKFPADYILNVQGDMPFIDPDVLFKILQKLREKKSDIVTSAVKVSRNIAQHEENVKVVRNKHDEALYFSRSLIPCNGNEFFYHVGVYGFTVSALERFVKLDRGYYEQIEKLEQLRALENGMKIGIVDSDEIPISIDTKADLEKARLYYSRLT